MCIKAEEYNKAIEATVSSREFGSAPVKAATKTLVMVAPRGIMTLSLIDKNCSPLLVFARSKISDKKVKTEFEASLQIKYGDTIKF